MVKAAHLPSRETSGAPTRGIDCMSVAVRGRACAEEAASAAAAAAKRSLGWIISDRRSKAAAAGKELQWAPRDPRNLALHMLVHHLRKMLVEPLLQHRPKHPADDLLERVDGRRRRDRGGDSLQLLE